MLAEGLADGHAVLESDTLCDPDTLATLKVAVGVLDGLEAVAAAVSDAGALTEPIIDTEDVSIAVAEGTPLSDATADAVTGSDGELPLAVAETVEDSDIMEGDASPLIEGVVDELPVTVVIGVGDDDPYGEFVTHIEALLLAVAFTDILGYDALALADTEADADTEALPDPLLLANDVRVVNAELDADSL